MSHVCGRAARLQAADELLQGCLLLALLPSRTETRHVTISSAVSCSAPEIPPAITRTWLFCVFGIVLEAVCLDGHEDEAEASRLASEMPEKWGAVYVHSQILMGFL